MSLPTRTLSQVVARVTAFFRVAFRGVPLGVKFFLGRAARAVALSVWLLHADVEDVDRDVVPSPDSSDDALSAWAFTLGLPDGFGGFGRLKPTAATGGAALLTGVKATTFTDGLLATAEDGTTTVKLSGTVTISGSAPGFGSVAAVLVAVTTGTVGNLPAGTVMTWSSPPAGADATFALTSPLAGAIDTEDNAAVYARIVARLQNPPQGGVASDYELWAETVPGGGVFRAYVFPKRSGTGSVDVVIAAAGSGQARRPSSAVQTAVNAYLLTKRPAAVDGTSALIPYMPNGAGHLVRARVTPASPYPFDWIDTVGGPFTVDTYTPGAPATLKLNTLAPLTLKHAIDAFNAGAGLAPRLQVLSTGSVVNPAVRATAWSDGGGKTTLTLENPLPTEPVAWVAPTAGDTVYAGGPVVDTIAAGLLALCDSLGPSRVSGFADTQHAWLDTLTISGLIRVVEDAVDTDGTKLVTEAPVGGVTVDGSVLDVQASDNSPNGPEMLYLSHVAVTA